MCDSAAGSGEAVNREGRLALGRRSFLFRQHEGSAEKGKAGGRSDKPAQQPQTCCHKGPLHEIFFSCGWIMTLEFEHYEWIEQPEKDHGFSLDSITHGHQGPQIVESQPAANKAINALGELASPPTASQLLSAQHLSREPFLN
ncbi:MAG: hypothetical protein ABW003_08850 [Microvirga sp.]